MSSSLKHNFNRRSGDTPRVNASLETINTRDVTVDGESNGHIHADLKYLRPKADVEAEIKEIVSLMASAYDKAKGGYSEGSIALLEFAAMRAYDKNHYELLEQVTHILDDLYETLNVEAALDEEGEYTYDSTITTPAP